MATDNELVMRIGNSTRVEESQIRQYKWASEKDEQEAFMYCNIINFKRSSNPRGHAHHCVMCGDRKAAIPSQNKDVCKTCDSGYWLVESVQVVVKFCKGCKNFTRLHDFRDKPEATKCIKCRQRGRQNYFAKKGRSDVLQTMPTSHKSGGGLGLGAVDTDGLDYGPPTAGRGGHLMTGQRGGEYDYYMEDVSSGGPRVTSSRQQALQKSRMSKNKNGMPMTKSRGRSDRYAGGQGQYIINDPSFDSQYMRGVDHERSGSFSSLLNGSYMPGEDGGFLEGDDDMVGPRTRSDTLLSISSVGLAGLGESLGVVGSYSNGKKGKQIGRTRVGSEEWDLQATGYSSVLTQDVFDNDLAPPPSFSGGSNNDRNEEHGAGSSAGSISGRLRRGRSASVDQNSSYSGDGAGAKHSADSKSDQQHVKDENGGNGIADRGDRDRDDMGHGNDDEREPREKRTRRDTMEMLHSAFM